MTRKLSVKRDVLAELTADDLTSIGAGAISIPGCVKTIGGECGIPTCGYTCTNTSTVFKG